MKKSLPANAKISKEAKETVQECVSEFISFITGEASDKCQKEKRKTINGDDLLWAMTTLGFENYVGPLKVYLNKYRETEGEKNSMARQEDHQSPPPAAAAGAGGNSSDNHGNEMNKVNGYVSTEVDFQGFNSGFYSLGAQVSRKSSYGENSRFVGYGDHLVDAAASFNMNRKRENGDANNNRPMAAHIHHGVEW